MPLCATFRAVSSEPYQLHDRMTGHALRVSHYPISPTAVSNGKPVSTFPETARPYETRS